MGRTICKMKKRGKSSIEWYKDGKPQYYCLGWNEPSTDELIEICKKCHENVYRAQSDLEAYNK